MSSGLSAVAVYFGVHYGCRRVRLGSQSSLGYALAVIGFIRGRWVHSCTTKGSSDSSGVSEFIGVHPWCRKVHLGGWVHWSAP